MNSVIASVIRGLMVVEKLSEKAIIVLFFLYERGEVNFRQIGLETGISHTTIYRVLLSLYELGLVEERRYRNARLISLSPRGKNVVRMLYAIEYYLQGREEKTKEILSSLLQSL